MSLNRFLRITLSIITISLVDFSFSNAQSYLYNFDSGTNEGWVSYTQSGSSWERGTPTASGFQPAFTAPNCWGIDLDSGYRGNTIAYLTSPMMQISNLTDPYLSFRQFRYMPFGFDGFHLEYSTNGTTWQRLTNGLYADNWYNTTSVFTTALPGFTGTSNGWQQSGIHLNYLGHIDSLKVRFVFNSYIFGSAQPGVLIDQISLTQSTIAHNDLSTFLILSPSNTGNNQPIDVVIFNNSSVTVDTFTVGYIYNNVTTTSIVAKTIAPGNTDIVQLGTGNFTNNNTNFCVFARGRNDYNYSNDTLCINLQGSFPGDLSILSVSIPSTSYTIGTNTGNIAITVTNMGNTAISSFVLGYKLNGVTYYPTPLSGTTINPGAFFTFYLPGFTITQATNQLCAFCQMAGDINATNDTLCIGVSGNTPQILNFYDDFESGATLWYADNSQSIGTNWELGFPQYNITSGVHSGSNAWDINLTTPYASYANAYLYSPYFDLSNTVHPKLEFWQNRNSELNWDGLRLEVDYGTGWNILGYYGDFNATNWYTNPSLNSSQLPGWDGNSVSWQNSTYKLDVFSNQSSVQFRYVFTSDVSIETDGVSIDDFSIKQSSQYDGALIQSSNFDTLLAGYSYPVSVYLQNQGIINISNLSIQYQLNNSPVVNQNWNGNLPLDSIALVALPNFTPVGGWNILTIYINWPLDLDQQNNSITLYFYATYENDAALLSFTSPQNNIGQGTPTPVQVVLQNQGSFPLTNVAIKYTNNNGVPLNYNWSGNLPKDSTTLVTLQSFIPVGGTNNLKAYIDWSLDAINSNDTINLSAFAIVTANLTYSYDFENGDQGWYDSSFTNYTQWELGNPTFTPTNFSHSGTNCWDINLNTPYFNVAYAHLYSPLFIISNYTKVNIDFWLNYSTEYATDGTYLEYSLDGSSWESLGTINDPNGTNWYNTTMFGNNFGWTGNSSGWKNCSYSFSNLTGANILQLKFVFKSDINLTAAGISLDDITLQGVVGLNENTDASKYLLFPNPSNQNCHVAFPYTTQKIYIMDANGKSVVQHTTHNETSRNISTANFSEGFYLIRFVNTNGTYSTRKLQVIH